jgi:CheY-like chemotaxis protein
MAQILIAEDDAVTRRSVARCIERGGHAVMEAENGKEAWERLEQNPEIGLLLTDVMMPEMDGLELIRRVRREQATRDLPIIIMSAYVTVNEISSFLKDGATLFLPKPVDSSALHGYLDHYLGAK